MAKYCPNCNDVYDESSAICDQCGRVLVQYSDTQLNIFRPELVSQVSVSSGRISPEIYESPGSLTALRIAERIPILPKLIGAYLDWWETPQTEAQLLGNGIEVTPNHLEEVHACLVAHSKSYRIPVPRLFISYRNPLNGDIGYHAFTIGTQKRPVIVLTSSLFDDFTPRELSFVLAHECGHICSNHVVLQSVGHLIHSVIAGVLIFRLPFVKFCTGAIQAPLLAWMREAEYSADLASLLCTRDIEGSCMAMTHLSVGSKKILESLDFREYLAQNAELSSFQARWYNIFHNTHPYLVSRVVKLLEYYKANRLMTYSDRFIIQEKQPRQLQAVATPVSQSKDTRTICPRCGMAVSDQGQCAFCDLA